MTFALGVERSAGGQPWKWRRSGEPGLTMDALVDELLLARGVARDDLERHRKPTIRDFLPDPSCFQDMDKGARRLADAVVAGEKIAIFGDYDVDGATSAALLVILLRRLGADPMVYIPDRLMEGYGPSGAALVELKQRGASLAVTVDCGAQAFEALQEAKDAGLDVIVVDHHQCATLLPVAFALINPNRLDEGDLGAAHGHLAAVGMAFLLGVALLRELRGRGFFAGREEPKLIDLLDLVALGTVADVARLQTLNRAFVTQGLKVMAGRQNIGLSALAEAARLVKAPSCRDLGFALGPRINAGGRVGKSDLGVRLLTSTDPEEARTIAAELDRLNEERRAIEMQVCEQALEQADKLNGAPVLTVMGAGWHPGVIGIVAGRVKERFGRPAIVIAETEDGTGKGSGRSISGVDLGAAVLAAKDSGLLLAGGGHAMAAGLTLAPGGLDAFRDFISERLASDVESAHRWSCAAARRHPCARRSGRRICAMPWMRPVHMAPAGPRLAWPLVLHGCSGRASSGTAMCAGSPAATTARASSGSPFEARRPSLARPCFPRPATSAGGSRARSSATNGMVAMRPRCTWRTLQ